MFGRIIQEQRCPRCCIVRIVRVGPAQDYFCLHCGWRWPATPESVDDPEEPLELRLAAQFTPLELERLRTYRAAVRAGFYEDWSVDQARNLPL